MDVYKERKSPEKCEILQALTRCSVACDGWGELGVDLRLKGNYVKGQFSGLDNSPSFHTNIIGDLCSHAVLCGCLVKPKT